MTIARSTASKPRFGISPPTWILLGVMVIWLAWALPLALEMRTLFLRDVLTGALPLKFFGAEQLNSGSVPVFNSLRALGQPHSGNPNALPFYPGNVLYLLLPTWSAFNLHYAIHLLIACLSMMAFCRRLGLGATAALMGGITYAGSGWVMSCLTFYNILPVVAWWPLVMAGAIRDDRRGLIVSGIALGLSVLGGEPITAAIGLVPVLWLTIDRHGWSRGVTRLAAVSAIGVLISLPQLVATLRILDFTVRGGPGLPAVKPGIRAFHPVRLLELIQPYPFGVPGEFGPRGFWQFGALPTVPYFYTIYFGIVGFWLSLRRPRNTGGWVWLALAGMGLSWIGGVWPSLFEGVSSGLFRYSEKFLFWVALAVPVLAAQGLDQIETGSKRHRFVGTSLCGAGLLALTVILYFSAPSIINAAARSGGDHQGEAIARTEASLEAHVDIWVAALLLAGVMLILAALAARQRKVNWIVVLQIVGLAQLYPLAQTMPLEALEEPSPWLEYLPPKASLHNAFFTATSWQDPPAYRDDHLDEKSLAPARAEELDPAFGIAQGLEYPLAEDFEGLYSPLNAFVIQELAAASWEQRARWLRLLGVDHLIVTDNPLVDGLEVVASRERLGVRTHLLRVQSPVPRAWWPERVTTIEDPGQQFAKLSDTIEPLREALVPIDIEHVAGASVEVVARENDRWRIEVNGSGGLLIVRRAFQPLLRATSGDVELTTLPADFCLLGVVVPPGIHEITIDVERWPQNAAWALSLVGFGLLVIWGWRR